MQAASDEVLVVGAGPVGLMAAGELAGAGVRCTVLERRADESNLTRAFAVHARTLELLDARGMAGELVRRGEPVDALQLFGRLRVDLSHLPTRFPFLLVVPQYDTEAVLEERARRLGAEIARGSEVTGLRQDQGGVDVDVRDRGGAVRTRRAAYVVGADGVGSAVRRELGMAFPGRSVLRSVILADVRLSDVPPELTVVASDRGFSFVASFGDGWYRVIAWDRRRQLPDSAPVDLAEVREIVRLTRGTDYGMHEARWLSRFHSDERQVARYRAGRVFLAGDAAHVHSPAGGLGMNAGLQDAANLGWKLAAAVRGRAPAGLLDSYHAERHPVGRSVLRISGAALRGAIPRRAGVRALRDVLGGAALRIPPVGDRVARTLSGIGVAYPAPPGAHPMVGLRAPDFEVSRDGGGAERLYEALRRERFVLAAPADGWGAVTGAWSDRVDVVRTGPAARDLPPLLVRPDGYIAWASEEADAGRRRRQLADALAGWCGDPEPATAAAAAEAG